MTSLAGQALSACGTTPKPVTHFCGRVFGGAIQFEQNAMFDRTSQTKF
jgi:hypothetical protein